MVTRATKGKFDSAAALTFTYLAIKPRKVWHCTASSVIYLQSLIKRGKMALGLTEEWGKQKIIDALQETATETVYK